MKNKINKKIKVDFSIVKTGTLKRGRVLNALQRTIATLSIIALLFVWSGMQPIYQANAAGIDTVVVTLVDSELVSTESQITVVFTPITALAVNDTITVYMGEDSGGDPWVDTDGTVDNTDITCAQGSTTFDT